MWLGVRTEEAQGHCACPRKYGPSCGQVLSHFRALTSSRFTSPVSRCNVITQRCSSNEHFWVWTMTQLDGLEQQLNLGISRCCNLLVLPCESPPLCLLQFFTGMVRSCEPEGSCLSFSKLGHPTSSVRSVRHRADPGLAPVVGSRLNTFTHM